MRKYFASAAAIAVVAALPCGSLAQDSGALTADSLRPNEITCGDLSSAPDDERSGLIYFIAGYQAGSRIMSNHSETAGAADIGKSAAHSTNGADTSSTSSNSAASSTTFSASGSSSAGTGGAPTAAAGVTSLNSPSSSGASSDTPPAESTGSPGSVTSAVSTDTGSTTSGGAAEGGAVSGAIGTESDKMAGTDTSDVRIARAFFSMSADDILASCSGKDDLTAAEVIGSASSAAK